MITKKTFIIANAAWALVAVAAFMGGRSQTPAVAESSANGGGQATSRDSGSSLLNQSGGASSADGADAATWSGGVPGTRVDSDKMAKLLGRAFSETNPILRKQMMANLLANLNAENVDAALAAFEAEPKSDEMDRVFADFLYAWSTIDGEKAIAYALDPESPKKSYFGGVYSMMGWASKDQAAAMAFVAGREPSEDTAWLHYGVFRNMLDANPQAASEYLMTNTKSNARGRAMDKLTEKLYKDGGSGALKSWLDGIDHTGANDMESYKTYAIRSVIDRVSKDDPDMAKKLIEENYGQPFVNFETLRHTAWRVSDGEGAAGMDWLASLPESKDRSRAFGEMVGQYAQRDPNVVATWLNERPDSAEFDSAASIFAQSIVNDDPVSAVAWARSLKPGDEREKTLRKVIKSWQKADPAAATAWLQNNS